MLLDDKLTTQQQNLLFKLVKIVRNSPSEAEEGEFYARARRGGPFHISYLGKEFDVSEASLKALDRLRYVTLEPNQSVANFKKYYVGTLMAKASQLYDQQHRDSEKPEASSDSPSQSSNADSQPLSPHDEYVLLKLVELELDLPREQQSHRFEVSMYEGPPPGAGVRPVMAGIGILITTDDSCLLKLEEFGYVDVDSYVASGTRKWSLELKQKAFEFYASRHGFPLELVEESRILVDTRISTEYPEIGTHLKKAYEEIWVDQPEANWSNVAHRCDDALETFADKVWEARYADELVEDKPPKDKYVKRLGQVIRRNADDVKLRALLVKLQEYVTARRHDSGTTQREAKRIVLHTYLVIGEIYELLYPTEATQR